tara:strand:+ start:9136 stop:9723 length:588 start_codon:yes stop_codon:yes gene_type:complete
LKNLESHSTGIGNSPALVVVDMCKGFIDSSSPLGFECSELIDSNIQLVKKFRDKKLPIIFSTTIYRDDEEAKVFRKKLPALNILKPNSYEVSFLNELAPNNKDMLIEKKYASVFFKTTLAEYLKEKNIDTLVISGVTTSGCVRATALDSLQHDFLTIVPENCVGDRNHDAHQANLFDLKMKYADVVHSDDLFKNF